MIDETLTADQHKQIISYLRSGRELTVWVATLDLGITQLSKRICELEAKGFEFDRKWQFYKKGRTGRRIRYLEYRLPKEGFSNG